MGSGSPKIDYESSQRWADIVPIPQNEGGPSPLAAIAYTDEYTQATSYLRAVMANNEMSERVLELTEHIIGMNPAHYTVWLYRAATLQHLASDPLTELQWLNKISLKHLKNYQIWQHRQTTMAMVSELPTTELPFLSRMLAKDEKNYHVWSYRQWLVQHFDLWPKLDTFADDVGSELKFTENLIENDLRNNSAWNHRFFVVFGKDRVHEGLQFDAKSVHYSIWEREIKFAMERIMKAPQNGASWNYLSGVLRKQGTTSLEPLKEFAEQFVNLEREDEIRSTFALDLLTEVWEQEGKIEQARKALGLLSEKFDPIRKNYWNWRAENLYNTVKT